MTAYLSFGLKFCDCHIMRGVAELYEASYDHHYFLFIFVCSMILEKEKLTEILKRMDYFLKLM